jgi:hypothetical protein
MRSRQYPMTGGRIRSPLNLKRGIFEPCLKRYTNCRCTGQRLVCESSNQLLSRMPRAVTDGR